MRDLDAEGRIVTGSPSGELVAAVLRGCGNRTEAALLALRRHRVPVSAAVGVAVELLPVVARDERWEEAVKHDRERALLLARALAATAAATRAAPRPAALLGSALGPAWTRDVDLLVGVADVAVIGGELGAAGFIDLGGFASRPAAPSRAFAAVEGMEVLAPVDLTTRLFPGGPSGERALARATRPEPDALPVLALDDQLQRRAGKVAQARRVTVRDALELLALLELSAPRERTVGLAVRRCAALERELGIHGPLSAGASTGGRPPVNVPWIRARARGARARAGSLSRSRRVRVSFSGVDGAGKSTQAALLVATLGRAGVPASAVWARLGYSGSPALSGTARLAQRLLPARHHSAQRERAAGTAAHGATPMSRRGVVGWAWALAVVLDYLRIVRREAAHADSRVLVHDRGLADALVALDEEFGGALRLDLHRRLLLRFGPAADVMFYLRLPGRQAHGRKEDSFAAEVLEAHARRYEAILPRMAGAVVTLDAERPPHQVADEVVRRLAHEVSPA